MSENNSSSILIIDDDPRFRQVIAAPLLACGYKVIEAHSTYEATAAMNQNKVALAIVDFRLPEVDGLTWISQMREQGSRVPMVFISGNACDAKTFNRLRNILGVSLVLQKPIVPELLLDQLDSILPPRPVQPCQIDSAELSEAYEPEENKSPSISRSAYRGEDSLSENQDLESSPPRPLEHRLQVQHAIDRIKQQYFRQLPDHWLRLTDLVTRFQDNNTNESLRQAALEDAHRLGGTAGSLGFTEVGSAAQRLQELLKLLDPADPAQYELISTEIMRLLVHGANSIVLEDEGVITVQVSATSKANSKILLFADKTTVGEDTLSYCQQVDCHLQVETAWGSILSDASAMAIDGIVVDLTSTDHLNTLLSCRQLREANIENNLPMSCLVAQSQPIDAGELLYSGFSPVLNTPVEKNELLRAICQLLSTRQATKRRVLVIDDDEALCNFIASILSVKGILVQTLCDPFETMTYLDKFRPHLVLLDVMMPGISGYDICRLLKATDNWQHLPVLYLTSKNTPEARSLAYKAGGDDFLSKPVETEELIVRTNLLLDKALTLRKANEYDALTGCLKGQIFYKKLYAWLSDLEAKHTGGSVALLVINRLDESGGEYELVSTEMVLASLGQLLRTRFPSEALRARCGEKDLVLFVPKANVQATEAAINLLAEEFANLVFRNHKGEELRATFSSSVVDFPSAAPDIESIVGLAYEHLASCKEQNMGILGRHRK